MDQSKCNYKIHEKIKSKDIVFLSAIAITATFNTISSLKRGKLEDKQERRNEKTNKLSILCENVACMRVWINHKGPLERRK